MRKNYFSEKTVSPTTKQFILSDEVVKVEGFLLAEAGIYVSSEDNDFRP